MTMTLTDQLRQQEATRRAEADRAKADATRRHRDLLQRAKSLDEYRALVARQAEPGEGDGAAMNALMAALGLSTGDVLADIDAVAEAERLAASVVATGPGAARAAHDAAVAEVVAGWRASIARLAGEVPEPWLPNFLRTASGAVYGMLPHAEASATSAGSMLELASAGEQRMHAEANQLKATAAAHARAAGRLEDLKAAHPRVFGNAEAVEAT